MDKGVEVDASVSSKKKKKNDPVKIVGGFHFLEQQIWDLSNKHGLLMECCVQ